MGRGLVPGYPGQPAYLLQRPGLPPVSTATIAMPPPPRGALPSVHAAAAVEKKTSVYVGKIPLGVKDETIKTLLERCGTVVSWKRVEDVETKQPKGFGFCEYEKAEHVMRALRLLNGFFLGHTALLLKACCAHHFAWFPTDFCFNRRLYLQVDSKTQTYLDDFLVRKKAILKAARAGTIGTTTSEVDALVETEFVEANRTEDARVQAEIKTVIDELIIDGTMAEVSIV